MTKPLEPRCGTCKHWPASVATNGRRIYSGDPHLACKAPLPELPALPACVPIKGIGDGWGIGMIWPPTRRHMSAKAGTACTFWEPWK
jgi:hypothetical protein